MLLNRLILVALILSASLSRFIPHPPNFTPIIAMGLLGGIYFNNKQLAVMVPLIAMFLSDIYIGFHGMMIWVYSSIAIIALLSRIVKPKLLPLACASLGGSLFFFLLTNFGVWISSAYYQKSLAGLITCYVAGLPFLQNTISGTLLYIGILFSIIEIVKYSFPHLRFASYN